ncbi:GrpB family protein [Saccharibacillus alkalitolerans]|uniref:GrpB family protein n=1 Tax=Saccharibacillus alkalitolerans TaxID=2705290 RepID=A0ABX0FAH4_9BACL|nr:GrpB family protein [Saccharibacillus alkalitolerans]NGZ77948.1 GrpB family protein [Saccharibacillus alkalitolerans]
MQVRLSTYDPDWVRRFEEEADFLRTVFGGEIVRFEHFGSTSVPGMKAKPVIDMMMLVRDIGSIDAYNEKMTALGYEAAGDWGIPGRRLFRKGGADRTHHIHVYEDNHPQIARHLVLRDYLRIHPDEAEAYSALKERLASEHAETSGYSPAKKAFVSELEKRALAWQSESGRSGE